MPYFAYAVIPAQMQQATPHAYVTGNITEAQYTSTYGQTPANAGIPGQTNAGFPTKTAAQNAANAFNKNPGPPLGGVQAPGVAPGINSPLPKIDLLGNVNVGAWLLRIGEVLLGIVLIAVGVAHVTHAVPIATKIAKTAGAGALLA